MIQPVHTEDIEHLDFDVLCERCGAVGETIATWIGVCAHAGGRWWFCLKCSGRYQVNFWGQDWQCGSAPPMAPPAYPGDGGPKS